MGFRKYYMGLSDYWGKDDPGKIFEDKLLPLLNKLGIKKEKDIIKIFDIVTEIAEEAYDNGGNNRECEIDD